MKKSILKGKSLLVNSIVTGTVSLMMVYGMFAPLVINADTEKQIAVPNSETLVVEGSNYQVVKTIKMTVTAYSSTKDQTDDSPFITASQKHVADGIIAINGLPFGTKVRIPKLFGNKLFTVEDRTNTKYGKLKRADIWFSTRQSALKFGAQFNVPIEIVTLVQTEES